MKGNTVFQRHHTQISFQFRHKNPVADTPILGLNFFVYRVFDRGNTPFKYGCTGAS